MTRPSRKIGFATVMSFRCPVAIQGVLVMRTSPGRMSPSPISLMKVLTVTGSVPMNEGIDSVFWARDWPAASVNTQAKSFDSLTSVENEVRRNALAASSTAEIVRRHKISSVTASNGSLLRVVLLCGITSPSLAQGHNDIAGRVLLKAGVRADQERRLTFFHNRWAINGLAGGKRIAVQDFGHMEVGELRKVDGARAFNGWRLRSRRGAHRQPARKRVNAGADPYIDDLDLRRRRRAGECVEIALLEGPQQMRPRGRRIGTGGQRHDQLGGLADIANVGEPDNGRLGEIRYRSSQNRPGIGFKLGKYWLKIRPPDLIEFICNRCHLVDAGWGYQQAQRRGDAGGERHDQPTEPELPGYVIGMHGAGTTRC